MNTCQMNLADRDTYLVQIETQIAAKRTLLLNKKKYLEKTMKQNQFLEGIKNDYQTYHNYIAKQKQEELRAMDILKQYIGDLMVSGKLTDSDIRKTKLEQNEILSEMSKIKKGLDEIVNN